MPNTTFSETKQADRAGSAFNRFVAKIPSGWKTRHLLALIIAALGTYAFLESRAEWSPMHRWNRAIGDMSLVMVAISMSIGPLSRLIPSFRWIIPFRRELGIYGVILAIVHTVIILDGWVVWDFARLFGFELHPQLQQYVMLKHGFGLANAVGIVALLYGLVLALSSSNWCQRVLGGSAWKFLQQGAYVLWMLIVLHTAYFLFMNFLDYHRPTPEPNWAQWPFVVLVGVIILLQLAAYIKTWSVKRNRERSDRRRRPAPMDRQAY